jgi:hypothetical protein
MSPRSSVCLALDARAERPTSSRPSAPMPTEERTSWRARSPRKESASSSCASSGMASEAEKPVARGSSAKVRMCRRGTGVSVAGSSGWKSRRGDGQGGKPEAREREVGSGRGGERQHLGAELLERPGSSYCRRYWGRTSAIVSPGVTRRAWPGQRQEDSSWWERERGGDGGREPTTTTTVAACR